MASVYDAAGAVTPAAVAQSVNTEDVAAGSTTPPVAIPLTIATTSLGPTAPGAPYSRSLQTVAGAGPLTCSVVSGTLPPGLSLSSAGTISGTPTTPGNYRFTVRCVDASGNADDQPLYLQIDPNGADWIRRGLERCGYRLVESRQLEPAWGSRANRSRVHFGGNCDDSDADPRRQACATCS